MSKAQARFQRRRHALAAVGTAVASLLVFAAAAVQAQTPSASDIAAGGQLYRQKGSCQACHGWAGDGRKMDSQMPDGSNLRETTLDRNDLITAIKCGRPGTGMPAYDRLGYSDGRCYGLKQADLRARGLMMPDPPATLIQSEIDTIVDFLVAKMIGQGPMNHGKCIEFWGSDLELCKEFPE